jgi:hypothetical protein
MTRKPVKSSQLAAIGYDPISQTLEVEFTPTRKQEAADHPGSIYQYSNVAPGDAARLEEAESVGSHFIKIIKADPERFPFKKIS